MGEVVDLLRGCDLVGIDTNCFIFQLESGYCPQQAPLAQELFELVQSGEVRGVTSTITITEVMTSLDGWGRRTLPTSTRCS